jgi:hypothetical protein
VNALVDAGYDRSVIEVHDTPQQLYDYVGRATHYLDKAGDKANIIIRRNSIGYGSANDLGFKLSPDGKYQAIVSEYDTGRNHWGPNSDRMKRLKVAYSEHNLIKTARKQGFKFLGKKIVAGKVQMQWMDTRAGA